MKFKTQENLKNLGVSSVMGIILMVAVSVALVALASTLVFDITGNVNKPSTGSSVNIESQQQSDNILVSVNRNPDLERVFVRGDGIDGEQEIADSEGKTGTVSISPSSTEGTVEVVGETVDGGEQVLETEEYEDYSGAGSGQTESGSNNNGVSGVVKINPPINGANVKAVKADGTAIATDVTDSNGEYKLGASPSEFEKVVVNVNGADELSNPLYTSDIKMADSANVNFNFDETSKMTTDLNGDGNDEFIIFETDSNGNKLVGDIFQLQAMNSSLSASYKLVDDIDASGTENWNNEKGFEPIGSRSNRFSGELDGQGYEIQGLHIERSSTDDIGLFASTNVNSEIKSVVLSDINITGSNTVGGLIGYGKGTVLNSYTEGRVKGDEAVGGLVGGFGDFFGSSADSIISNSHSTAEVNGSDNNVGGLVGVSLLGSGGTGSITISNSYATGSVIGGRYTGGLVGQAINITISGSYATGSVTSDDRSVGGLVGGADVNNEGRILDSYATGSVTGNDNRVGGLIGYNAVNVSGSYATGSVTGVNGTGGFIGYNNDDAHILNSYATGSVDGDTIVGGFVGYSGGIDVSNSYATGSVSGNSVVGGFIGSNTGSFGGNIYISDSYATGSVSGDSKVGGFVADAEEDRYDDVDVSDSYWDTEKTGQSSSAVLPDSNGLKTSEMQGSNAELNMNGFDFGSSGDWNIASNQYPVLKA